MKRFKFKIAMVILSMVFLVSLAVQGQTVIGCVIYEASGVPRLSAPIATSATSSFTSCNGFTVQVFSPSATGPLDGFCFNPSLPNASPALFRNCIVGSACGIIKTITVVNCPIDGHVGYIALTLSTVAIWFIRRPKK
jgi:hypothetical protein